MFIQMTERIDTPEESAFRGSLHAAIIALRAIGESDSSASYAKECRLLVVLAHEFTEWRACDGSVCCGSREAKDLIARVDSQFI